MAPAQPKPDTALPLLMFLLVAALLIVKGDALSDSDTGWHIAAGRWIWENGTIPATNLWAHTAADIPWYNISWLFDVLLAGIDALGGLGLVYGVTVLAYAALLALLFADCLRAGANVRLSFIVFAFCIMPLVAQSAVARPHIVTAVMVYAFMRILSAGIRRPSKALWLLPVLMVLWVNMHGGFLAAPFLFAAYMAEAAFRRDYVCLKRLFLVGVPTALAMLANPYGADIHIAVRLTLEGQLYHHIEEWAAPNLLEYRYLCAVLGCLFLLRWRDETPLAPKLLTLIWLIFLFESGRHGLVFAVVAAVPFCQGLTRWAGNASFAPQMEENERKDRRFFATGRQRRAALALAAALVLALMVPPSRALLARGGDAYQEQDGLQEALRVMRGQYPDILWVNEYELGGWLIYEHAPQQALFMDGRAETAYGNRIPADYLDIFFADADSAGLREQLARYGAQGLILRSTGILAPKYARAAQWRKVHDNGKISLFLLR